MTLQLVSPAFEDGQLIPEEYGYEERNVNPPLEIQDDLDGVAAYALLVDDPDAIEPAGKVWDHWVVADVPADRDSIPEDWDAEGVEGQNDYGEVGYGGPNPPDGEHAYRFRLLALEDDIDVEEGVTKDQVEAAAEGSVLDEARLVGMYAP